MTPAGLARLKMDEGCRLAAYQDTRGIWTIGYGSTCDVRPGDEWTQVQADTQLMVDVQSAEARLSADLPWFAALDPVRQDVLVNIAFNVGVHGLLGWPTTLSYFRAGAWESAAHALETEGAWDRQVGARAERLAAATLNGHW